MSSIVKIAKIAPSASIVYQFLVFFYFMPQACSVTPIEDLKESMPDSSNIWDDCSFFCFLWSNLFGKFQFCTKFMIQTGIYKICWLHNSLVCFSGKPIPSLFLTLIQITCVTPETLWYDIIRKRLATLDMNTIQSMVCWVAWWHRPWQRGLVTQGGEGGDICGH